MTQFKTASLGFSRVGSNRELKFTLEKYWKNSDLLPDLEKTAQEIRKNNWLLQSKLDYIPSGDFSYYDHVLDLSFEFNNIPTKFNVIKDDLEKYFAVARGYQKNGQDFHACELSKWFNTNYHYIIPELHRDIELKYIPNKFVKHFIEAKNIGLKTRPVIIGPVSYLLLSKEKTTSRQEVINNLIKCYNDLLNDLEQNGCTDVQIDEPFLATNLSDDTKALYDTAYKSLNFGNINLHLVSYFDSISENIDIANKLPVKSIHFDISEFDLPVIKTDKIISLGLINGRNIWKNNLQRSFEIAKKVGLNNEVIISPSCSFLHVPYSVECETDLKPVVKERLAFAKEKLDEIILIKDALTNDKLVSYKPPFIEKNDSVWRDIENLPDSFERQSVFEKRKEIQRVLNIPLFPTTTIGSFPQDQGIRKNRSDFKQGLKTEVEYDKYCKNIIADCIQKQEEIGLDVLVHGECERNDMVEYFGENLEGFCFTKNGWVQSYGSRCVKPPIIYGDVCRRNPITIKWAVFSQSCSKKHVKGMLTGPVTILKWSFVRDDIPLELTCKQIAIALQGEVLDLESNGIKVIQIDEPAIREILPVKKSKWDETLKWAVDCFKISAYKVDDSTQIHTHVCYSDFNEIIEHIVRLDADVLSIESSRSDLEILSVLTNGGYKNDIGPGVWDIHSPRVPTEKEIHSIIEKALKALKPEQIWVNPDCGLKTRGWDETTKSLKNLVAVARFFRDNAV